jgi:hypothetical protein
MISIKEYSSIRIGIKICRLGMVVLKYSNAHAQRLFKRGHK